MEARGRGNAELQLISADTWAGNETPIKLTVQMDAPGEVTGVRDPPGRSGRPGPEGKLVGARPLTTSRCTAWPSPDLLNLQESTLCSATQLKPDYTKITSPNLAICANLELPLAM